MELRAIVYLLVAALAHASWNVMGKHRNPSAAFFVYATLGGMICLTPILCWDAWLLREMPASIWKLLFFASFCQAVYFLGLAWAYRKGHVTIAYPLARTTPVVLVALINVLMGKKSQIGNLALIGMMLIGAGCLLLPMKHFREFRLKNYLHVSSLLAILAGIGSCGYSMIDNEALHQLRQFASGSQKESLAIYYLMLEMGFSASWLLVFMGFGRVERAEMRKLDRTGIGVAVLAGAMIVAAYGLTLMSMAHVSNVSYVVAFRQVSIPVGVAMGVVLLKEPFARTKALGVMMLLAGLLMVGLG